MGAVGIVLVCIGVGKKRVPLKVKDMVSVPTNWFDQEINPACRSISDALADLRSNPEAGAIIDRMMAQAAASRGDVAESVKDNPVLQRVMGRMTLVSLLKQAGGIDGESIKQLNRVLQGIKKRKGEIDIKRTYCNPLDLACRYQHMKEGPVG